MKIYVVFRDFVDRHPLADLRFEELQALPRHGEQVIIDNMRYTVKLVEWWLSFTGDCTTNVEIILSKLAHEPHPRGA